VRPLLLDLFCGAGGASAGYERAGFEVVGVDVRPQPRYPFAFVLADAFDYLDAVDAIGFDAIHASPPCQAYSDTKTLHSNEYPDLVDPVRERLSALGLPYVLENVEGAPLFRQSTFDFPGAAGVLVCGSSFGLRVRRHRLFESNVPLLGLACRHVEQGTPIDVTGGGPSTKPRGNTIGGRTRKPRTLAEARDAMGMDWGTRAELNQAIPPAYTEFVGKQILRVVEAVSA
jgi:DNA (cytosine-5)-methyltransferase 1